MADHFVDANKLVRNSPKTPDSSPAEALREKDFAWFQRFPTAFLPAKIIPRKLAWSYCIRLADG